MDLQSSAKVQQLQAWLNAFKRAIDGTASSALARETGKTTRPLAEMGWDYAQNAMRSPTL